MTYEEFLEQDRIKALQAITAERVRYTYAQRLHQDYSLRMASLQLGALTWLEIGDRLADLDISERCLDEDYSDTEANRDRYAAAGASNEPAF